MSVEAGYPITLVHPQHKAAKIVEGDAVGEPERFPGVTVNGAAQEAQYRALGYLRFGEPPPMKVDFHEFPKTLRHPEFVPEQPARVEMRIENGRPQGTYTIPAIPAVMPDVIVLNAEQEERARANGYRPAGEYDSGALQAVLTGTVNEESYVPQSYPKWVDGEIVESDPAAPAVYVPDRKTYPRYENGVLVQDPNIPAAPDPREYPKWIHRDGIPSEASLLANNIAEEVAIRARWEPAKQLAKAKPASSAEARPVP